MYTKIALPYVYKITHKTTNQFYIGSRTSQLAKHYSEDLGFKYFTSSKVVKSLGFENFKIDWIEEFQDSETAYKFEQLIIFESFKDPLCLNKVCHFGKERFNSTGLSWKLSDETKKKMSIFQKNKTVSSETKNKLSLYHKNMSVEDKIKRSKKLSERVTSKETRKKISNSRIGSKLSTETKQKISNSLKGRKLKSFSKQHKEKLSEAHKGKKLSIEHKTKISESCKGKKHTEESKLKMSLSQINLSNDIKSKKANAISLAHKGKIISEETKIKLSNIQKGTIWANDGIKSFKIKDMSELKEGHVKGRLPFKKL